MTMNKFTLKLKGFQEFETSFLIKNRSKNTISELSEAVSKSPEEIDDFYEAYDDFIASTKSYEENKAVELINSLNRSQRSYILNNKLRKAADVAKELGNGITPTDVIKYISISSKMPSLITKAAEVKEINKLKQKENMQENIVQTVQEPEVEKNEKYNPGFNFRTNVWTDEEDIILLSNKDKKVKEVVKLLPSQRTEKAVNLRYARLRKKGLSVNHPVVEMLDEVKPAVVIEPEPDVVSEVENKILRNQGKWSPEERDFVINNMDSMSISEMAVKLNRNYNSVVGQVRFIKWNNIGLSKSVSNVVEHVTAEAGKKWIAWSEEDEKYIVDNYSTKTIQQIGDDLNRTYFSVNNKAFILRRNGLIKEGAKAFVPKKIARIPVVKEHPSKAQSIWDKEQDQILIDKYEKGIGLIEICQQMGRSYDSIRTRLRILRANNSVVVRTKEYVPVSDNNPLLPLKKSVISEIEKVNENDDLTFDRKDFESHISIFIMKGLDWNNFDQIHTIKSEGIERWTDRFNIIKNFVSADIINRIQQPVVQPVMEIASALSVKTDTLEAKVNETLSLVKEQKELQEQKPQSEPARKNFWKTWFGE